MSSITDKLRRGRDAVGRGRLSFDIAEAREKMRKFRLPNPHFYVLQFVRAASVLGAKRIEFELEGRRMVCTFDEPVSTDRFDEFWGAVFEARSTPMQRALHNLALGVGSAQALKPQSIRVQSGTREIVFTDGGETVTEIEAIAGTRIEMTEKFRFGHLLEFFTEQAELTVLSDYCRHARMLVFVDGESVQGAAGNFRTDFETPDETGWVALGPSAAGSATVFHFLRDDVLVNSHHIESQVHTAVGVLNSRTLRTDLSGLELAADEDLDPLVFGHLFGAYHASVQRWLSSVAPHFDLTTVEPIFHHIMRVERLGHTVPPGTRALVEWWLERAIFVAATSSDVRISADDARHNGAILYATEQFGESRFSHVLLANSAKLRSLMTALHAAGYRTRNVTVELRREREAIRNRRAWESRPVREDRYSPVVRTVTVEGATGAISAPFAPNGEVEQFRCEFTTYVAGRPLRRQSVLAPITMWVDGDLEPDPLFEDVERDQTFRTLVRELCGQVPYYVREVLKFAHTPPSHPPQIRAGFELLHGLLDGSLFVRLAEVFGLEAKDVAAEPLELAREVNRLKVLERLGEIATLPLIDTLGGERRSLEDLYLKETPPVVIPNTTRMADDTLALLQQRGFDVIAATPAANEVVRHIRPGSHDESYAARIANEARYLARPPFEPSPVDSLKSKSHRWVLTEGTFVVDADLLGEGDRTEVVFVFRDRVLARRHWPSPAGHFRVIVRCDQLSPTDDYNDLAGTELVDLIYQSTQTLIRRALIAWCIEARQDPVLSPEHFRLLWSASMAWAEEKPDALTIGVWVWNDGWQRSVMSQQQLSVLIGDAGGVIRVHRGQSEPPTEGGDGAIVCAPADVELAPVITGRVVEVGAAASPSARKEFFGKPTVSLELPDALFEWSGELEGLQVVTGLFDSEPERPFGHQNIVDVLWQNRVLERIADWVPFGSFKSVIAGGAITPDPEFSFVGLGRGDVMRAANHAVVRLIDAACAALPREDSAGELEAVRRNLLIILVSCRRIAPVAPFDTVLDTLQRAPLFATTTGKRLALDELEQLAFEGVVPYVTTPNEHPALLDSSDIIEIIEEAFGDRYALLPFEAVDDLLDLTDEVEVVAPLPSLPPNVEPAPQPVKDEILDPLRRILIEVGESSHQLSALVRRELSWDSDVEGLCEVDYEQGIRLRPDHQLVRACRAAPADETRLRFLASVLCSSANQRLEVITDRSDIQMQAALLAAT